MGINGQKKTVKIPKFEKRDSSSDSNQSYSTEHVSSPYESRRKIDFGVALAAALLILIVSMLLVIILNPELMNFGAGPSSPKSETNAK
jgi:hypothetical protein